jgi:hypothetical protein
MAIRLGSLQAAAQSDVDYWHRRSISGPDQRRVQQKIRENFPVQCRWGFQGQKFDRPQASPMSPAGHLQRSLYS